MKRGPGPAGLTPVLRAGLGALNPLLSARPPTAGDRLGVLRSCLCFTLGEKCPSPSRGGGGMASWSTGLREGRGKSSGCAGVGEVICHENCTMLGTPAQFSSRYQRCASPCQPLLAPLPRGHLGRQAHWGSPKRRPPGNKARDGHKGLLVAQGLGTGEIRPPNKGQGFFLRKWQQSCPWRQQLLELG